MQILLYFGSLVSVLYYFEIIQNILKGISSFINFTLNLSPAESLNVVACVFLGNVKLFN